jgi:hypothetical protein
MRCRAWLMDRRRACRRMQATCLVLPCPALLDMVPASLKLLKYWQVITYEAPIYNRSLKNVVLDVLRCAVWWTFIDVSAAHSVSTFRVKAEAKKRVNHHFYHTTMCEIPQDSILNSHRTRAVNLETRISSPEALATGWLQATHPSWCDRLMFSLHIMKWARFCLERSALPLNRV